MAGNDNGLTTFSMHAFDPASAPLISKLKEEHVSHPMFASLEGTPSIAELDPETVARRYLSQALESKSVPELTAPVSPGGDSEFKGLGTETVPLTGTKTVKFRQTFSNIPVYGSLVTVELDDNNNLVSMNSSLGRPDVSSVAKVAPADALKAVDKYPGFRKQLANIVPHLNYYYEREKSKWRLVYILEDVPVWPTGTRAGDLHPSPRYMDYVVDAQSGTLVAELPRTPSMSSVTENAVDGKNQTRNIQVEVNGDTKILRDLSLNVQTFDFKFSDPQTNEGDLPGKPIANPPQWAPSAVSAHANAAAVSGFLREVLLRNNIDNQGGPMNSSINCVVADESKDGRQWFNAFWNGTQMVYGQRSDGNTLTSLAIDLDVVAHEMFHGVTNHTARLEYAAQPGALNESYSDIFGVIIANFGNPDSRKWNWQIGEGLSPNGKPFRDMQNPSRFGQPEHMKDFKVLPNTRKGDWGGVHTNSGIHNKAAYNILTAEDGAGNLALTPKEVAAAFYLALTQQLSRTSQFGDSCRAVLLSARTLFRTLPSAQQKLKLDAITNGFSSVGIN